MPMEQLHTGELYLPGEPEIMREQEKCLEKLYDFNATRPGQGEKREQLLKEMFAEIGEGCYVEAPFYANWGGHHVHFGKNVYANYGEKTPVIWQDFLEQLILPARNLIGRITLHWRGSA